MGRMTQIVIFPSVLGVRAGVEDAAGRLAAEGHAVFVADWREGATYDEYEPAMESADAIPRDELMARADAAVEGLPDRTVVLGFSMGCVLATHVALTRPVGGVILFAGAIPASALDGTWPGGVPAQVHQTLGDPFRDEGWAEQMGEEVQAAGGEFESFDYPGRGHLFTDPSLPEEYDAAATELAWERILPFVARVG